MRPCKPPQFALIRPRPAMEGPSEEAALGPEVLLFWGAPLGLYLRRVAELRAQQRATAQRLAWLTGELAFFALVIWGVS